MARIERQAAGRTATPGQSRLVDHGAAGQQQPAIGGQGHGGRPQSNAGPRSVQIDDVTVQGRVTGSVDKEAREAASGPAAFAAFHGEAGIMRLLRHAASLAPDSYRPLNGAPGRIGAAGRDWLTISR